MFWMGGSPCAGKSTVADMLAERYGLTSYHCDGQYEDHKQRADPGLHPVFHRMSRATWEELFMAPVDVQVEDEFLFYRDEFPMIIEDLAGLPDPGCVIAEGAALLPRLVHGMGVGRHEAVWVVPTKEFQLHHYAKRGFIHGILAECPDPEKAFSNWMERDMRYAEHVAREARELGYRVVVVDGGVPPEAVADDLAVHFGLV